MEIWSSIRNNTMQNANWLNMKSVEVKSLYDELLSTSKSKF